ncbi:hypothetical protein D9M71_297490 [compost metagenome]
MVAGASTNLSRLKNRTVDPRYCVDVEKADLLLESESSTYGKVVGLTLIPIAIFVFAISSLSNTIIISQKGELANADNQ